MDLHPSNIIFFLNQVLALNWFWVWLDLGVPLFLNPSCPISLQHYVDISILAILKKFFEILKEPWIASIWPTILLDDRLHANVVINFKPQTPKLSWKLQTYCKDIFLSIFYCLIYLHWLPYFLSWTFPCWLPKSGIYYFHTCNWHARTWRSPPRVSILFSSHFHFNWLLTGIYMVCAPWAWACSLFFNGWLESLYWSAVFLSGRDSLWISPPSWAAASPWCRLLLWWWVFYFSDFPLLKRLFVFHSVV